MSELALFWMGTTLFLQAAFSHEVEEINGFSNSQGLTRFQPTAGGPMLISLGITPSSSNGGTLEIIESMSPFDMGAWQESVLYPQYLALAGMVKKTQIQIPAGQDFKEIINTKYPFIAISYTGNGMLNIQPLGMIKLPPSTIKMGRVDVIPGL